MKKISVKLLIAVLFTLCACYADDKSGNNPGFSLNPQDVPIFYDNNPLSEMKAFVLIFSIPVKDIRIQEKIEKSIERALAVAGQIIYLKDNDMRGFGTGNVVLIQVGNVKGWDGSEISTSRISLSVETSVTVDKTGRQTFPIVWSINAFLPGPIDAISEGDLIKAVQKLVGDFVENYKYVNHGQIKTPVFYVYD